MPSARSPDPGRYSTTWADTLTALLSRTTACSISKTIKFVFSGKIIELAAKRKR